MKISSKSYEMKPQKENTCDWTFIEYPDVYGWGLDCGCFDKHQEFILQNYDNPLEKPELGWQCCPYCGSIIKSEEVKHVHFIVTGGNSGIGNAFARYALDQSSANYRVHVSIIDIHKDSSLLPIHKSTDGSDIVYGDYSYYNKDVSLSGLPDILNEDDTYLINCAGIQEESNDFSEVSYKNVFDTNVYGVIQCTNEYAFKNSHIKSVVNLASTSAHTGAEFGIYAASKGAVLAFTKFAAKYLDGKATCNSISFGGVISPLNEHILTNEDLTRNVLEQTLTGRWATLEECAKWIWFVSVENTSMTAQDIVIDNGEMYNHKFIW